MSTEYKNRFLVIKFLEVPYENFDSYACVPESWVRFRGPHKIVCVAYPTREDPAITIKRIKRKGKSGKYWNLFRATVQYVTDQFYEAVMWMEMAKKNEAREYLSTHLSDTTNQSIPKMEIETRTFMESTSSNPNINKPEMILVPMGNIRNVPIERAAKRISKRSLSLDSTHELLKKLPRMVKIAESANNVSNHSSNSIGIHEDYSNQELRTQGIILNKSAEAYNTEKLVSPESNTNNTTPALQTSTSFRNQAYQLSKLIHDKRISVVSDDYLFQDRGKREIITDRSTLANGNDQITCPQRSTQNTESAMQTLINLKNRCSQLSVRTHANQPLTANKNYVRQEPRGHEKLDRRPTEVNHGTYSQDVTNNKLSILANRASEHSAETQYPQAYNIIVQKDSLTNKIIIEPSTEMECIDQRAPSQSVTNTAAAAQNSLPLANQPSHLSVKSHETQKPPDFGGYLEDPRTPTVIIRTTTGGNAMDLRDNKEGCHLRNYRHMTDKTKNTQSAVQEFSNLKNHLIQSEPLHEKHNILTASKNYLKEDPHAKTIFNGCPTQINGIDQKAFPQSITKNTPFATSNCQNSANSFSCSCKNSQRQRFASIDRDYFNQYPRMQSTLSGRPTEGNCSKQNVNPQSNTDNKSFANRYSPITANESQSSRDSTEEPQLYIDTSDHQSQECTQEIPVKRFINQDCNGQSVYTESNTNNTTNRASIIQNTANPSFEESSSSSSSTDQERYAQEIPVKSVNNTNHTGKSTDHERYAQEIPVKSVNNTNHTGKSTIPETNTENRSTIIRNSPVEINKLANDRAITEQMLTNDFNILFRKMESTLSDTYAMLNHVCDSLIEYGESFQIILKRANDYCNSRINESTGS